MKPLTEIEWTTCIMAVRYSMNGQTISTSSLPPMLVEAYWDRWSDGQKQFLARDLQMNKEERDRLNVAAFGNPDIDAPTWLKFMAACDLDSHCLVTDIEGRTHKCFKANNRIYPLDEYVKRPYQEIFLPDESIFSIG